MHWEGKDYSRSKPDAFKTKITNCDWTDFLMKTDSDKEWQTVTETFLDTLYEHAPLKPCINKEDREQMGLYRILRLGKCVR